MNRKLLLTIIIVAMIATVLCVYILYDQNKEYSISYDLGGGLSDGDNPRSYSANSNFVLNDAVSEKYVFNGWYTPDNKKMTAIPSGSTGDITLHAEWTSNVGKKVQYDVIGKQTSGDIQYFVDSSLSFTYIHDCSNGYLIGIEGMHRLYYRTDIPYSFKNIDEAFILDISDWKVNGNVYTDGINTIEMNDQKVPTKLQFIGDGYNLTFSYISESLVSVQKSFDISVINDFGFMISNDGEYLPGENVVITVTESETMKFLGWYDTNGVFLSDSLNYEIDLIHRDIILVAEGRQIADKSVTAGTAVKIPCEYEMKECDWTIRDRYTWETIATLSGGDASYLFEPGVYQITYNGIGIDDKYRNGTYDLLADGDVEKSYHWIFDDTEYDCTLSIPYGEYAKYRDNPIYRSQDKTVPQNNARFVTYDNDIIGMLALELTDLSEDMTNIERAAFLLSFVQNIQYVYDTDGKGIEEYWKYPIETLFEEEGDCEDTSILFAALGKRMGFDVSLFLLPGHMAGGIALDGFEGQEYHCEGVTYYFAETIYPKYALGEVSSPIFTEDRCTIVRVY